LEQELATSSIETYGADKGVEDVSVGVAPAYEDDEALLLGNEA
jgi:hypothetical protein